jgi:hypothetical protein
VTEVLRRRLAVQRLVGPPLTSGTEVVRLLTCVQSQEHAHALWSLGLRCGLDASDLRSEFDQGHFVRTHLLRPTWHFVAAADLRWIQALTASRVQQGNRGQYRAAGLSQDDLDRGRAVLADALTGRRYLTRPELAAVLAADGLVAAGHRLACLVMDAELEGVLCSGPMRGAQHTYALVEERLPAQPVRSEEDMLAMLTWRFFAGHGPAGLKDYARWSSLTLAQAQAGIELVTDRLERVSSPQGELWHDPSVLEQPDGSRPVGAGPPPEGAVLLVPLFDEVSLSYPQLNFPVVPGHPHPPGPELHVGSVLLDTENVGTWRRTVQGRRVTVETDLAPGLGAAAEEAVVAAVRRLAGFLGRELAG